MNWNAGTDVLWPSVAFRIKKGEVLLVSRGSREFGLLRLERNLVYQGFPDQAGAPIRLYLRAI